MNAYQKATMLLTSTFLPLVLLFMNGMNYRGVGITGLIGIGAACGLVYALRAAKTSAPRELKPVSDEASQPVQASRPQSRSQTPH